MSLDIEEARARLYATVSALEDCRDELTYLGNHIPPSRQETSDLDLDGVILDVPTELRAVIAIELVDRLEPLIRALKAAAAYRPPRLDLSLAEEAIGAAVRGRVIEDWFTEQEDEEAPGGVRRPAGTPEQAELKVCKAGAVWIATWRKLDAPADAPEEDRWECVSIREHPQRAGALAYREIDLP